MMMMMMMATMALISMISGLINELTWQYSQNNSNHGESDAGDEEE